MKNYKPIIFLTAYLLVSCGEKANIVNTYIDTIIPITENTQEKILYSKLFDSMKYIALETSDDVLIKKLTKVKYFNNRIFVLDETTQSLFIFGINGKLIRKIHNVGHGPNEYFQLRDFDIDEENNKLFLYSRYEKIQIYDFEGKFIEEYKIKLIGSSFVTSGDKIYFYTAGQPNFINGKNLKYNLLIFDKGNIVQEGIHFKNGLDRLATYNLSNSFCKYDGEIHFFMSFSNNIYSIKNDSIYIKYHFDFGKYNIPDNYFDNHTIGDLENSKYTYGLNSYWVNRKYCCFNITYNKEFHAILYYKDEKKISQGYLYDDIAYCFPVIHQATDSYTVCARQVEDLFVEYNYAKKDRKNTILEKIVSEITEDDNPVIFLYYFKH
jgi:hypothetical protein